MQRLVASRLENDVAGAAPPSDVASWMADVATWASEFAVALVRDACVLPRSAPGKQLSQKSGAIPWHTCTVSEWEQDLYKQLQHGNAPCALVNVN